MEIELPLGLRGQVQRTVALEDTALHVRSGKVAVLATPVMIGMMEEASVKVVDHLLPAGHCTVGIHVDVSHSKATPQGMRVTAHAELHSREGGTLTFRVTAIDEQETVGEGTHKRAIIDLARFQAGVQTKAGSKS